jgi:hypothetical protein
LVINYEFTQIFPSGSNAVQSHAGALFDVILEWFVFVIPKIGLECQLILLENCSDWE